MSAVLSTPIEAGALLAAMHDAAGPFVELRRDLHRHPELGFAELRTAEIVAERLAAWGYAVTREVGGTGANPCFSRDRAIASPL